MSKLITGGTGLIGSELARILAGREEGVVLFDVNPQYHRIEDIKGRVKVVRGNLANIYEVFNVFKENNIKGVFHFGGMLSVPSNQNPWASFQANVCGTMNVLEAARLFGAEKVVFSSTTATYSMGTTPVVDDQTIQRPVTMYGCGKLYGELLGAFYRNRFGLDFRSLRYPAVIGPGVDTPGMAQYNTWMIEHAIQGKKYECFVSEDTKTPVMYYKDAAIASDMLYDATMERIVTINYNCAGVTPIITAGQLEKVIKKYIPEFEVEYRPDPDIMKVHNARRIDVYDDSKAKGEWGWKSCYSSIERVVEEFIHEMTDKGGKVIE